MVRILARLAASALVLLAAAGSSLCTAQSGNGGSGLVGAWRGNVQFRSGAFADTKDLEFMYAFAPGGTMTESSNYDASPPVPPAYGVWRKVGRRTYEAKYEFYQSKSVASADELAKQGGWAPDGHGTLLQKITLSADGNAFDSTITLRLFDKDGKPVTGGGEGTARAKRIVF